MPAQAPEKSKPASAKKSVSLPPDLMAAAIARAADEQRNFSNYIQKLITQDLTASAPKEEAAA